MRTKQSVFFSSELRLAVCRTHVSREIVPLGFSFVVEDGVLKYMNWEPERTNHRRFHVLRTYT